MTNLTATILNVSNGEALTINGSAITVVHGGEGRAVVTCRGARNATVLLVQNAKSGRWYMLRAGREVLVETAAA